MFEEKYSVLPGDMSNATSFWSDCIDHASIPSNTCDGDGNGGFSIYEEMRFWQHLSLSGLIEGNFNGNQVSGSTEEDFLPQSDLGDHFYVDETPSGDDKSDVTITSFLNGNVFWFDFPPDLLESELYSIDKKMDDGEPYTGWVGLSTQDGSGSGCLDSSSNYDPTNLSLIHI